ncbi:MAG: hypothetical protein A2Z07_07800 [Armatimonadetes bacterium RBG_16_67_12]|nr:MAG: hypothetical protein A2Z07_07800 [Armatimonadetes bacterium RBG_16_67_12]
MAPARAVCGGELLLGEVLEERSQRPIEDLRRNSVRDLMPDGLPTNHKEQEGLRGGGAQESPHLPEPPVLCFC